MNLESSGERDFTQSCGACGRNWHGWRNFILDPGIRLIGFQMIPEALDANLLVFEHRCGSSVSVMAKRLRHLLPNSGTRPGLTSLFGTTECNQHCRTLENLEQCEADCVNARDRRLIRMVLQMKRQHG